MRPTARGAPGAGAGHRGAAAGPLARSGNGVGLRAAEAEKHRVA
ncbi:hypothetical protein ABZ570_33010 [Micromonospora sp. NPDC007271]